MHHAEYSVQKAYELHLTLKARSFHNRVEYPLMKRGDFPAPLQVRSLERDEIRLVGEWRGEGCGIARVSGVDHSLMNGTDGVLVSGS